MFPNIYKLIKIKTPIQAIKNMISPKLGFCQWKGYVLSQLIIVAFLDNKKYTHTQKSLF